MGSEHAEIKKMSNQIQSKWCIYTL